MAIPAYVQPTGDFAQNYVVQPSDWNSNFDDIAAYLNNTVKPAIDGLEAQGIPTIGGQSVCGGRLIVGATNQNFYGDIYDSTSTLSYLPFEHDQIGLWSVSASAWQLFTIPAAPAAGGANLLTCQLTGAGSTQLYMLFIAPSGATVTLQALPASGNFQFQGNAGTSAVLTLSANPYGGAAGNSWQYLAVGQLIWIHSAGAQTDECCLITSVNSSTNQITVDSMQGSYIAGSFFSTDSVTAANVLTLQDGVPVLASNKTWRFVGLASQFGGFQIFGFPGFNSGLWDNQLYRGLSNYYNQIPRTVGSASLQTTWAQAIGFSAPAQVNRIIGQERAGLTLCTPAVLDITRIEYQTTASVALIHEAIYPNNVMVPQTILNLLGAAPVNPPGAQIIGPGGGTLNQKVIVDATRQPGSLVVSGAGGRIAVQDLVSNQAAITFNGQSTAYNAGAASVQLSTTFITYMG